MDSSDTDGDGFGDNLQRLTFDEAYNCDAFEDVSPQWSPNSSLIAFTSTRSGYFDIWLVNANDPTDLRNVTQTPDGYEDQPSWSPDGTRVIFRSSTSGQYEMYSLPVPPPSAAGSSPVSPPAAAEVPTPTQVTFDEQAKQQADWGAELGWAKGTATLRVARQGKGRVTGPKIACMPDCAGTFVAGNTVKLTAVPHPSSHFVRWAGACSGTKRTCAVRLELSERAIAVFAPKT